MTEQQQSSEGLSKADKKLAFYHSTFMALQRAIRATGDHEIMLTVNNYGFELLRCVGDDTNGPKRKEIVNKALRAASEKGIKVDRKTVRELRKDLIATAQRKLSN